MSGRPTISTRHDRDTNDSDAVSNLSSLDTDDTDEFGKLLIQHARDERRMRDAITGSTKIRPFRKARPQPRLGASLDRLERREREHERGNISPSPGRPYQEQPWESPSSVSSAGSRSDPPLRPPREWGRKGRRSADWLRKAMEPTATGTEDQREGHDRQEQSAGGQNRGSVDWAAAAADVPLPSIEDRTPSASPEARRRNPLVSSPLRDIPSGRSEESELFGDLTMGSILASTPAPHRRNTFLDDIRAEEIESLKDRAIATSRLDAMRETASERLTSTGAARTASSENMRANNESTGHSHPPQSPITIKSLTLKRSGSLNSAKTSFQLALEGGDRRPDAPTVDLNASQGQIYPARPSHKREDSHDLLRRLARVSSSSPSPGRPNRRSSSDLHGSPLAQAEGSKGKETASTEEIQKPTLPTPDPTPDAEPKNLDNSEKENIAPETRPEDRASHPPIKKPILYYPEADENVSKSPPLTTPRAIGAWVDTPGVRTGRKAVLDNTTQATRGRTPPKKQGSQKKASPVKALSKKALGDVLQAVPSNILGNATKREPQLPSSALDAIVGRAKAKEQTKSAKDDFGDSTIESLEELLGGGDDTTTNVDEPDEDTLLGLPIPKGTPKNDAERQRQREALVLHKMNARLRATRTSIRDADRGLRRVEHELERIDDAEAPKQEVKSHNDHGHCGRCGCPANGHYISPWNMMWSACAGLVSYRHRDGRLRPTRLGWICIVFLLWTISEWTLE